MLHGDEYQIIDIGDAAIGHPLFDLAMVMMVYLVMPDDLGREKGEAEVRRMLGFDPARAPEIWRRLCGTYFGLSSAEEIEAVTRKLMPYSMLWNVYHRINRFRRDSIMLQIMLDVALRKGLLPAIEQAPPLDF